MTSRVSRWEVANRICRPCVCVRARVEGSVNGRASLGEVFEQHRENVCSVATPLRSFSFSIEREGMEKMARRFLFDDAEERI